MEQAGWPFCEATWQDEMGVSINTAVSGLPLNVTNKTVVV